MTARIRKTSASPRPARTKSPVPTTTSRWNKGFTLIEILIVLAIVSMVMTMGLPAIQQVTNQRINSTTRKFVGLVRTIRNDAILLNSIYRLAFDLDKRAYWVEEQQRFQLLNEANTPVPTGKSSKNNAGGNAPPANFTYAQKYSKQPIPLPGGVAINGILKEKDGMHKEGMVYVHFFPNGFNEQAILYLNKEGSTTRALYSLIIRPTSGRVEVRREYVDRFDQ